MKTKLPSHSHTATTKIYQQEDGRLVALINVKISVPSRVAAMLPEYGRIHSITCAGIGTESQVGVRALGWKRKVALRHQEPLKLFSYLELAASEGCDTSIRLRITPEEWHLVGMLCGKLGITPGQWYVACAAYNAEVEESLINQQLADLPAIDDTALEA